MAARSTVSMRCSLPRRRRSISCSRSGTREPAGPGPKGRGAWPQPGPGPAVANAPARTLTAMKRVALLGATGSIGRQAIEIIEAHPALELCAASSGSTPLDDVNSPLKQVGGDLTELLERAAPDVVLNAVVGFA